MGRRLGGNDDEISGISSVQAKKLYKDHGFNGTKQSTKESWQSDITFENVPSDYRATKPSCADRAADTGGDALWASGYDVYNHLSPPYHSLLETLTVTCEQPVFGAAAKDNGFELYAGERGAPVNTGMDLKAIRSVVRINPISGWKSIFAAGHHAKRVDEVVEPESEHPLVSDSCS